MKTGHSDANRRRVLILFSVSSSEKVDKEHRYADFNLVSVPYPGCEFFRVYKEHGFNAEGLFYDWSQVCNSVPGVAMPTLLRKLKFTGLDSHSDRER